MKAVLFDLGDTLIKTPCIVTNFQKILKTHGIYRAQEEILTAYEESEKLLSMELMKTMFDEFWIKRNNLFLEKLGVFGRIDLAKTIAEEWWDHADVSLYPDVNETPIELKRRGIKMGIITNGLQSDLAKLLAKTGLNTNAFDIIITVDPIGFMKPEREIFHHALEKIQVLPKEALFVGDTIEYDYKGAKNAGLQALVIDRDGKINENIEKIRDLREILAFV
ncbi:MAG: HAD family hydrolase [Candidatus Bathyarchaeia archaeon]|nr:HAD family hydrolase [Candidatus Bathyarchaeota archaeon A05DMB-4]MDH7594592.1 HAD family hydrolase [Candidatus Bathyarchaeota archaeon]